MDPNVKKKFCSIEARQIASFNYGKRSRDTVVSNSCLAITAYN